MRKAKAILLTASAILGIGAAGLLGYGIANPTVTVRMTREEVQQRIDARMPVEGSRLGVSYAVNSAKVDLRPEGRIGVEAEVTAGALNRRADLVLAGSGVLAYRDGSFFLRGFKVERAVPTAVDEPLADEERASGGRLAQAIGRLGIRDRAADALEAAGVRDGAAFLTARKEALVASVREQGSAMLAEALDRRPVYVLREGDLRPSLARLALQDVRIEDGALVADLNVMRLAGWILVYALACVLGAAAFLGLIAAFGIGPGLGIGLALGAIG